MIAEDLVHAIESLTHEISGIKIVFPELRDTVLRAFQGCDSGILRHNRSADSKRDVGLAYLGSFSIDSIISLKYLA